MKLTKCASGHFYDADKYPECPYCNTGLQTDSSIVRSGAAEESPEGTPVEPAVPAAAPAGPVAGWLVVLDGEAKGRDLRLGVGRTFLGLDKDGTPVTLSADAPLSLRQAPRNCATWATRRCWSRRSWQGRRPCAWALPR